MSEASFGKAALHLSGMAAQLLGWRPAEFWQATPIELVTVLAPMASDSAGLDRNQFNTLMEQDNAQPFR